MNGKIIRVLCVGDVCGSIGCDKLLKALPEIKRKENIDAVIVNGENSADGNGMSAESKAAIFAAGADVVTGGNHSFRRRGIGSVFDSDPYCIRPQNFPDAQFGSGYCLLDKGRFTIAVINLLGMAFMSPEVKENPFDTVDLLLQRAKDDGASAVIVDFHAEATSEKKAMGYYLDGKVSAMFGTHTHIQTADAGILQGGTGYITDLGMTGPVNSVLGVRADIIIDRFKYGKHGRFELAEGLSRMDGCIFDIDISDGKTVAVNSFSVI